MENEDYEDQIRRTCSVCDKVLETEALLDKHINEHDIEHEDGEAEVELGEHINENNIKHEAGEAEEEFDGSYASNFVETVHDVPNSSEKYKTRTGRRNARSAPSEGFCKGCGKEINVMLKHLAKNPTCREHYDVEDLKRKAKAKRKNKIRQNNAAYRDRQRDRDLFNALYQPGHSGQGSLRDDMDDEDFGEHHPSNSVVTILKFSDDENEDDEGSNDPLGSDNQPSQEKKPKLILPKDGDSSNQSMALINELVEEKRRNAREKMRLRQEKHRMKEREEAIEELNEENYGWDTGEVKMEPSEDGVYQADLPKKYQKINKFEGKLFRY